MVDDLARLNADPRRGRRLGLAFALAVAISALALAFLNVPRPDDRERLGPVMQVVLERRPTPPPTPRPTPPPTPVPTPPPMRRVTPAPVQRAAPRAVERRGGAASAPRAVPHPTSQATPTFALPEAAGGTGVTAAASPGIGAGAGTGSGPGNGTGAGNGTGGNGTGTVNAALPCGFVEFIPTESPKYNRGTATEKIRATVHFPDGHVESDVFPYPWLYPNGEQTDPWSSTNLRINPNGAVRAQLPPPGTDTSRYPALIQYILTHTTADGITTLQDCPTTR